MLDEMNEERVDWMEFSLENVFIKNITQRVKLRAFCDVFIDR